MFCPLWPINTRTSSVYIIVVKGGPIIHGHQLKCQSKKIWAFSEAEQLLPVSVCVCVCVCVCVRACVCVCVCTVSSILLRFLFYLHCETHTHTHTHKHTHTQTHTRVLYKHKVLLVQERGAEVGRRACRCPSKALPFVKTTSSSSLLNLHQALQAEATQSLRGQCYSP